MDSGDSRHRIALRHEPGGRTVRPLIGTHLLDNLVEGVVPWASTGGYFDDFRRWSKRQKIAMRFIQRARVLDAGRMLTAFTARRRLNCCLSPASGAGRGGPTER